MFEGTEVGVLSNLTKGSGSSILRACKCNRAMERGNSPLSCSTKTFQFLQVCKPASMAQHGKVLVRLRISRVMARYFAGDIDVNSIPGQAWCVLTIVQSECPRVLWSLL